MNIEINDLTITSLDSMTALDIVTGAFKFTMDELQNATISQSQDKEDITGKQGRKLGSIKKNKAVKISGASGLVSAGLLELQTGSTFETNTTTSVQYNESLAVSGGKATTEYTAFGTAGNEVPILHIKNSNGTLGKALTQGATVSAGMFTYNPETKEIEISTSDVEDGDEKIFVSYVHEVTGSVMENFSDSYSEKCRLIVDATAENPCTNETYHVQFNIFRADFDGNFELAMGDTQVVQNFEAEALSGSCGGNGSYFTMTIFGAESA